LLFFPEKWFSHQFENVTNISHISATQKWTGEWSGKSDLPSTLDYSYVFPTVVFSTRLFLSNTGHTHRQDRFTGSNTKPLFVCSRSVDSSSAPSPDRHLLGDVLKRYFRNHPGTVQQRANALHTSLLSFRTAPVLFGLAASDLDHVLLSRVLHSANIDSALCRFRSLCWHVLLVFSLYWSSTADVFSFADYLQPQNRTPVFTLLSSTQMFGGYFPKFIAEQ
jgi:hypothetical protein